MIIIIDMVLQQLKIQDGEIQIIENGFQQILYGLVILHLETFTQVNGRN